MKEMHMNMQTGEVNFNDTNKRGNSANRQPPKRRNRQAPSSPKQAGQSRQGQVGVRTPNQPNSQARKPAGIQNAPIAPNMPTRNPRQAPMQGMPPAHNNQSNDTPPPPKRRKLTAQQKRFLKQKRKQQKKLLKKQQKQMKMQGAYQTPEQPIMPSQRKRRKTQNELKRLRKIRRIIAVVFTLVFVVVGVVLSINVFFKISDLRVEGDSIYTVKDFEKAFGVAVGENMFSFNSKAMAQQIAKKLPYLESIKVRRRLPSTVVFIVEPSIETFAILQDDQYIIVSQGLRVLNISANAPEGVCLLQGVTLKSPEIGKAIETEIPEKIDVLKTLLEKISTTSFLPLTQLDMTDPYNISFVSQGRFKVIIGTMVEIDYKLKLLDKIAVEKMQEGGRAVLDASSAASTKMVWVKENGF